MTDPVPLPPSQEPTQGGPAAVTSGPSGKTVIGWTAVMLGGLALAWFVGAVVVPVFRTRAAVDRLSTSC